MKYLLGIDLGTSGVKTIIFNQIGEIIDKAQCPYPLYQEQDGYAEQNPSDWWTQTKKTISTLCSSHSDIAKEIVGIGVSGQMHGLVLLNQEKKVLRRSIIWCDSRSQKECKKIESAIGIETLLALTGNRALPAFTASKLLWVKHHEPTLFQKVKYICLPKDYINLCLTDRLCTDVSDASGMQMMDIQHKKWAKEILSLLSVEESMLGTILESAEPIGRIKKSLAIELGINCEAIVVAGAGDQAASAIGNHILSSGQVSCSLGSSGVVFAPLDRFVTNQKGQVQTFMHAIKDRYFMMGVTQGCGISMNWASRLLYGTKKNKYQILQQELEKTSIGANGLLFLPYLMGERTPYLDPNARGTFIGLKVSTSRKEMIRAVMEGISFSLMDCLSVIQDVQKEIDCLFLSGGGAKNPFWCQMLADVMNQKCQLTNSHESGALGVAILASVAVGIYENIESACQNMIQLTSSFFPNQDHYLRYQKSYILYQEAYQDLKKLFQKLRGISE